jgi:hypothetical protein
VHIACLFAPEIRAVLIGGLRLFDPGLQAVWLLLLVHQPKHVQTHNMPCCKVACSKALGPVPYHSHKPNAHASSYLLFITDECARPTHQSAGHIIVLQVYDLTCLAIVAMCTTVLRSIKPGMIYYWLKVTQLACSAE